MRNVRLNPIIISIIGAVLCIGVPALIWFFLIQPVNQQIATENTALAPVEKYVGHPNPPDLIAARNSLAAAQAKATVIRGQWAAIQYSKNPLVQSADKWRAWYQWIGFLEFEFAPSINRFLHTSAAQPLTTVSAPTPPGSPNDVPQGIVAMPLGTISVFGSYNQILQQVESWNHFNRIVVTDGLSLQGYSPFMTGSYTATEYIYTESASGLPSTAPSAAATTTSSPAAPATPGQPGPGGFGAPGIPGAPGGAGGPGANAAGEPLPPPPSVPTNFEDTPEYRVHIKNPMPTTTTAAPSPFLGARR